MAAQARGETVKAPWPRPAQSHFRAVHEETLGSHIVHVHISDHGELGDCLQIGRGRFNIRKFLSMLNENSPDCSVMLELYRSNFEGISDLVNNYNTLVSMIGKL